MFTRMPTKLSSVHNVIRSIQDLSSSSDTATPDTSSTDGSRDSMAMYSYGLNGVNTATDNQSSQILYIAIGIIFVAITMIRLLQRSNAHLRQLTTYGSRDKQLYWTKDHSTTWAWIKRHIVYAPFYRIRHNKELQLSKAVNVGTLPGRLHFILLGLFVITQAVSMANLKYDQPQEATLAELRGRSGHLAILNMVALFIMAGRNNPFIRILRVSFDTFNLFHRWIGRIIIVESIIHLLAWGSVKLSTTSWTDLFHSLVSDPFLAWGLASTIAMVCILLHSPASIRHAMYETFLCCHQLLAFVALAGIFYHARLGALPQYGFVVAIVLIWSYDRLFRLGRIIYYNYSFGKGMTRVVVEALPGDACRVTFHTPRAFTPRAGSHVYAYLPRLSWWQSHPFSVAWTNTITNAVTTTGDVEKGNTIKTTATTLSLIVSARTGMTKKLHAKAKAAHDRRLCMTGFVEGPYGSLETLHSYGSILLFAGGVGITHHLIQIRDLIKAYDNKTISVQKITLIWSIRTQDSLDWVRPWMNEVLCLRGRQDILVIKIFVTKSDKDEVLRSGSARVQMHKGRPNLDKIVQEEFEARVGAMCVSVCGPGALADDVRRVSRGIVDQGKVDFLEEAFTW